MSQNHQVEQGITKPWNLTLQPVLPVYFQLVLPL